MKMIVRLELYSRQGEFGRWSFVVGCDSGLLFLDLGLLEFHYEN